MPKVIFSGSERIIQVNTGVIELDATVDLYSDWKEWTLVDDNAKYAQAFRTVGGDPLGGTELLGRYYFLTNNWKIKTDPAQSDELIILGNLFTNDGSNVFTQSVPFVRQNFSALTSIQLVSGSGGGGLTTPQDTKLTSIYTSQSLFDEIIVSQSIAQTTLDYLQNSGSSLTPSQSVMLLEMYRLLGLDPTRPLVVTPNARIAGAEISQSIAATGVSGSTVTVTRP